MEIVSQRDSMPWSRIKLRQKVGAALVAVLIILAVTQLLRGGEPQRLTYKAGLVELRLPTVPPGADITWESRQPLDLDFRAYEGGSVIVFYAGQPGQLVVTSDVIDWEKKARDKTSWIVTIEGKVPDVKPDPKPDDPPKPPDETDTAPIPNLAGLKVLLIYESGDLPPKVNIKVDPEVTGWLSTNTTPENGWVGWRVGDPESGVPEGAMHWEKMLSLPRTSLPWLVINNGTNNRGYSGPLPADSAKTLELLKRFK
jgi:hypothetical protein